MAGAGSRNLASEYLLIETYLVTQQQLVEIGAVLGDGTVGVTQLDGVTAVKRHDNRPADLHVSLHVAQAVAPDRLQRPADGRAVQHPPTGQGGGLFTARRHRL